MTPGARVVEEYLDRLREALPAAGSAEVLSEVEALVEDRIEQEGGSRDDPEMVRRALAALGQPEALATALAGGTVTIDLATRRAFGRLLAVVFAGHLLVSIVLSVIDSGAALIPGLVGALPRKPLLATACGVIGIFLLDAGLLGAFFLLLGRDRTPALLPRLKLRMVGSRRDAGASLLLLALIAVLVNVSAVRDAIFAVGGTNGSSPLLAPDALALLPAVDVVLLLFALRDVLVLFSRGERVLGLVLDALASLAGAGLMVLLMTRDQLVAIPESAALSKDQSAVFTGVLFRVVLVIAFVAGLLLATRFVKRLLRLREVLRA